MCHSVMPVLMPRAPIPHLVLYWSIRTRYHCAGECEEHFFRRFQSFSSVKRSQQLCMNLCERARVLPIYNFMFVYTFVTSSPTCAYIQNGSYVIAKLRHGILLHTSTPRSTRSSDEAGISSSRAESCSNLSSIGYSLKMRA